MVKQAVTQISRGYTEVFVYLQIRAYNALSDTRIFIDNSINFLYNSLDIDIC